LTLAACLVALGCGSDTDGQFAEVSGKVTVDGQPARDVVVTFEPSAESGKPGERPTSVGITDADGRYALKAGGAQIDGALVGKHTVRIAKKEPELMDEVDPNYNVRTEMKKLKGFEQLPARFNAKSTLSFDVTADGTDAADFSVESK
jgi:hypothetical protein